MATSPETDTLAGSARESEDVCTRMPPVRLVLYFGFQQLFPAPNRALSEKVCGIAVNKPAVSRNVAQLK